MADFQQILACNTSRSLLSSLRLERILFSTRNLEVNKISDLARPNYEIRG